MSTSQPPSIPNSESLGMLVDPAYERTLQNRVKELLAWRHDSFPGSRAVYFEAAHLEYLKNEDYFVCEQNDGTRCLLFTTITPKGPATFVIDSKNSFRYLSTGLPVRDQPTFQHETLLDGELVVEKTGEQKLYRYLICDLIVLNKVLVAHKSFNNRLGMLNQEVILPFNRMINSDPTKRPPFKLELKKMERSYGLKVVLEHKNNGLLFTPVRSPYTCGLSRKLLKWKDPSSYTADLKIKVTYNIDRKPIYSVMATCNLNHKFLDHLQLEPSLFTEWRSSPPDGRIAEFRWDSQWPVTIFEKGYAPKTQMGGWRFVRFRDDKDTANEEEFAKLVRDGMPHAVTREVLEKQVEEIRSSWKIREKSSISGMQPPSGQSSGSHSQQALHGSHERRSSSDTSSNVPRESPLPSPRHDQGFIRRTGSHDSTRKESLDSVHRKSSQDDAVKKSSTSDPELSQFDNATTPKLSKAQSEFPKSEKSHTKPVFTQTAEIPRTADESKNSSDIHSDQPAIDRASMHDEKSLKNISPKPVHRISTSGLEARKKGLAEKESPSTTVEVMGQDSGSTFKKQHDYDSNTEVIKQTSPLTFNSESAQPQEIINKEEEVQTQNSDNKESKLSKDEEALSSQLESRSNMEPVENKSSVRGDLGQKDTSDDRQSLAAVQTEDTKDVSLLTKTKDLNTSLTADIEHDSITADMPFLQSKGSFGAFDNNSKHDTFALSNESKANSHLTEVLGNPVKRKSSGVENQDDPHKHKKLSVELSPILKEEQAKRQPILHSNQQKQPPLPTSLYPDQINQPSLQPVGQSQTQQNSLFITKQDQKRDSLSDSHQSFNRSEPIKMPQPLNQRPRSSSDASIINAYSTLSGSQTLSSRGHIKNDVNAMSSYSGPEQVSTTIIAPAKAASSCDARFHSASPVLSKRPSVDTRIGSGPKQDRMNRRTSSGNETSLLDKLYGAEPLSTPQIMTTQSVSNAIPSPDVARLIKNDAPGVNAAIQTDQPQKFPHQFVSTQKHPRFQSGANLESNDNQIRRDSASNLVPFDRNSNVTGYTHLQTQVHTAQSTTDVSHVTHPVGYNDPNEFRRRSPRYSASYISGDKQPVARHSIPDIQHHSNQPRGIINNDNREALRRSMTSPTVMEGLKNDTFNTSPIVSKQQYGKQSIGLHPVEARERDSSQRGYRPLVDVSVGPSQYAPMMDPNLQILRNNSPNHPHPHPQNQLSSYPQGSALSRSQITPQPGRPQIHPSGMHQVNPTSISSQYHSLYAQNDVSQRPPIQPTMSMSTSYPISASKSPGYRHAIPHSPETSVHNSPQIAPVRQESWQAKGDVGISAGYPHQPNPQWSGVQHPYHPSASVYNSQSIHSTSSQPRGQPQSKGKLDFIMNSSEEEPDWRNTRL